MPNIRHNINVNQENTAKLLWNKNIINLHLINRLTYIEISSKKKKLRFKKKFRSYGSATSKSVIFHDLLISHLIVITFIVYKLTGFFNFLRVQNNIDMGLKFIISLQYCFNHIIDTFKSNENNKKILQELLVKIWKLKLIS